MGRFWIMSRAESLFSLRVDKGKAFSAAVQAMPAIFFNI